jgi:hypothetical protein
MSLPGLIYKGSFDSTTKERYTLDIYKKGYSGVTLPITLAGVPVVHKWITDEPRIGVKGSQLLITLQNDGSLPLTSFYSEDDQGFQVLFYWGTTLLFNGYLVQDDFIEMLVDYRHEITLIATDNLGLLKGVLFDNKKDLTTCYAYEPATVEFIAPHTVKLTSCNYTPSVFGGTFQFLGSSDIYTIQSVTQSGVNGNPGIPPGNTGSVTTVIVSEFLSNTVAFDTVIVKYQNY